MTVTIHLTSKQFIRIEDTNNVEAVWAAIKRGDPISTGRYGEETIVNVANVTNVQASR